MRAAVLREANARLEVEDRPTPEPGPGQVLIRVAACGVCHSDLHLQEGWFPYTRWPVVPGHEVAGAFATPLPDELSFAEAAPLLCAGLTVYGGLVHGGFRPGDRVAVIGLGGLGELAVRFARAMGGRVAVISRSADKEREARELGAELFVDTSVTDPAEGLLAWDGGGADLILATAPSSRQAQAAFGGLAADGTLVMLGLDAGRIGVMPGQLIAGRRRLMGSTTGTRRELRDALAFAAAHDVRAQVSTYGLDEVNDIWDRLRDGRLRGRAVLAPAA